ncbi:Hypothetical predicted protein [Olea europaea subsp. europaea]|uniref:Uncharacterized protein n=1 Tax=Olea europaea subsp. europaea TaxID=158383 RepID=A0A8S0SMC7_OLEEU|nr:Hypothetical predicted protein [Olea europaea subsp. europaea]
MGPKQDKNKRKLHKSRDVVGSDARSAPLQEAQQRPLPGNTTAVEIRRKKRSRGRSFTATGAKLSIFYPLFRESPPHLLIQRREFVVTPLI